MNFPVFSSTEWIKPTDLSFYARNTTKQIDNDKLATPAHCTALEPAEQASQLTCAPQASQTGSAFTGSPPESRMGA